MNEYFPINRQIIERGKAPPIRRNIDYTSMPRKTLFFTEEENKNMNHTYDNLYGYGDDWNDSFEVPPMVKPDNKTTDQDLYGYKLDWDVSFESSGTTPSQAKMSFYEGLYKKHYKTKQNPSFDELLDFLYDKANLESKKQNKKSPWGNKKGVEKQRKPICMVPNLFPQPVGSVLKQTLVSIDDEHDEQLSVFQRSDRELSSNKLMSSFDSYCQSNQELALEELTNRLYLYLSNPKVLSSLKIVSKVLYLKDKVVSKLKNKIKYFQ
jgi:hypothetical protein